MKKKILLLEDDINLNETIKEYLQDHEYDVFSCYDGQKAYEKIYENAYDLLLLDVNVPSLSGFELLKSLRKENILIPSIFLTSLNSMKDFEDGYDCGCDDYIRKPFELRELLLRVKTLLKNGYFHSSDDFINISDDIVYDINKNTLKNEEKEIFLNQKESLLVKFFLKNQDILISHEQIHVALWSYDETYSDNSLRTYIKNLRKIFGKDRIISVKKFGYRFTTK